MMKKKQFYNTTAKLKEKKKSLYFVVVILFFFSPIFLFSQQSLFDETSSDLNILKNQYEFSSANKAIFVSKNTIIYTERDSKSITKSKILRSKTISSNTSKKRIKKNALQSAKKKVYPVPAKVQKNYLPGIPSKDFFYANAFNCSVLLASNFQKITFQKTITSLRLQDFFPVAILRKDNFSQYTDIPFWKYSIEHTSRPPPNILYS